MKLALAGLLFVALALTAEAGIPHRAARQAVDNFWWNRPTTSRTTTTTAAPANPANFDNCMRNCLRTPQYDPRCGQLLDGTRKTYSNEGELQCAIACGEITTLLFRGACSPLT